MSDNPFALLAEDDDGEGESETKNVDVHSLYQLSGHGSPQPLLRTFCETMLPPKACLTGPRPWKAASIQLLSPLPGQQVAANNFDYTIEIAYEGRTDPSLTRHFKIHLHFRGNGGNDFSKKGSLKVSSANNPGNIKLNAHQGQGGWEAFIKSKKCCAAVLRRALKDRQGSGLIISIPPTFHLVRVNKDSFEDGKNYSW